MFSINIYRYKINEHSDLYTKMIKDLKNGIIANDFFGEIKINCSYFLTMNKLGVLTGKLE